MYTIDASVFINASDTREAGHATSRALIVAVQREGISLVLPTLALLEVAAGVARSRGDARLARWQVRTMEAMPTARYVAFTVPLRRAALALAIAHRLRAADALYAAVAQAHGTTLISLDREHHTRLVGIVPVLTPAAALAQL